ncbi:MAG UNVERIFIED_CONTAM: hypothetical protein LVR18_45895 [Planctomycetaceae bacterium]
MDWAVTFPAVDSDLDGELEPVGKPIRTVRKDAGGRDIYVYMGHDGNQRQALGVQHAEVSIADFIHMDGSFYFEKGPQQKITIATGLPQNLGGIRGRSSDSAVCGCGCGRRTGHRIPQCR